MAMLVLIGDVAQVEILTDPEDEELILARCLWHQGLPYCSWSARYDTQDDATRYAEPHADEGR